MLEFIMKSREEYDKLLDDSPDIPAITIQAFLVQFPDKENKPDVCNGLSIIVNDDAASLTGSRRVVSRWLNALKIHQPPGGKVVKWTEPTPCKKYLCILIKNNGCP